MTPRTALALLAIAVVLACRSNGGPPVRDVAADVTLRLLPRSPRVALADVPYGAVAFTATIRNDGDRELTIAHPSACLQAALVEAGAEPPPALAGQAAIELTIARPDGDVVVLRDRLMGAFDPGNVPVLVIPPRETGSFHVGFLFENARGRWDRDDLAATAFLGRGRYTVSLRLRNELPRAAWHGSEPVDVWRGVLEAPPVDVVVE